MENGSILVRGIKIILCIIVIIFALIGLHKVFLQVQFNMVEKKVEKIESTRNYDDIFLFNKNGGEPLYLINKNFSKTIFFLEGFRTQAPAGMYIEYFEKLHKEQEVNIIVPVYGLQSSPFDLRNREWDFHEDIRNVIQIYDSYTLLLDDNHKILTISQSFGTLPHAAILARGKRKPNNAILLSPLNTGMEFKAAGPLVYWFSKQTSWLRKIMLFSWAQPAPNRDSIWDIINTEMNLKMAKRDDANPEDSSELGYKSENAAFWMQDNLIPLIKNMNIKIFWGDCDLYFSQEGFKKISSELSEKNNVETFILENSGHMVLLDNQKNVIKRMIMNILK